MLLVFERYTESARRALFFARFEVTTIGGRTIESEHLLLGLIRTATPLVTQIFSEAKISTNDLRAEIERRLRDPQKLSTSVEIPFSESAKRALDFAAEEADRLQHLHIGTEHLLLALLRDEPSAAASALTARGLRLEDVRIRVAELVSAFPQLTLPPDLGEVITDIGEVIADIVRIQHLVKEFAREAIDRGASADAAQVILEEFETLKRRLEGD